MGAIQTRHHLLRWGKGIHEETTCLFAELWVPSEYNQDVLFVDDFLFLSLLGLKGLKES